MWCPEQLVAAVADMAKLKIPEVLVKRLCFLTNMCIIAVGGGMVVIGGLLPLFQLFYFHTDYQFMGHDLNLPRLVLCGGIGLGGVFFGGLGLLGCLSVMSEKVFLLILYGRVLFVISIAKAGAAVCAMGGILFGVAVYLFYTSPSNIKYAHEMVVAYYFMLLAVAVLVFCGIEFAGSVMGLYLANILKERSGH